MNFRSRLCQRIGRSGAKKRALCAQRRVRMHAL